MAALEFTFKSGVKTIDIKNEDGSLAFTISVNVGEKEAFKKMFNDYKALTDMIPSDPNAVDVDQLFDIEQKAVSGIIGEEQWNQVWEHCGHNVFAMLMFVKYLTGFMNDTVQDFYKGYV